MKINQKIWIMTKSYTLVITKVGLLLLNPCFVNYTVYTMNKIEVFGLGSSSDLSFCCFVFVGWSMICLYASCRNVLPMVLCA